MCILCSKLLYPQQSYIIKNIQVYYNFIKLNYKYNNILKSIDEINDFKCCITCKNYIKQKRLLFTYNNYGSIPEPINNVIQLNNYYLMLFFEKGFDRHKRFKILLKGELEYKICLFTFLFNSRF